jgi:aryl-alcohol dehydrogenase-like predicted oxidoreductase
MDKLQMSQSMNTSSFIDPEIHAALGLGLAALGRPAYMTLGRDHDLGADRTVAAMERRCHEMLDSAYARGIRYVDAARSYGLAERFLASWCDARQLPVEAITIGSKWGYTYTGGWQMDAPVHETKRLTADTLRRQWAESRALLGARLRLYQIHSATLESGVLDDRAVLDELMAIRAEGVAIGLTVTGPQQADTIRRALEVAVDGVNPFSSVQATWNLLERSAAPALAAAHAAGWRIIVKEVLANGRLTNAHADASTAALVDHAAALGTTLDALAVAAALSQPWTTTVLSGAVTEAQLESHLSARALLPLAPLPGIAELPDAYWHRRATLAWS